MYFRKILYTVALGPAGYTIWCRLCVNMPPMLFYALRHDLSLALEGQCLHGTSRAPPEQCLNVHQWRGRKAQGSLTRK